MTWFLKTYDAREPSRLAYADYCASCHGPNLEGTDSGPPLMGTRLVSGSGTQHLIFDITQHQDKQKRSASLDWNQIPAHTIKALALYVSERRQELPTIPESHQHRLPEAPLTSDHHDFRIEHVTDLPSPPYSMAPLPSGDILVVEKVRGLSLVDQEGQQSALIQNTPPVWQEILKIRGSYMGLGMMLDVKLHPNYENNGWIYLSHTDRCQLGAGPSCRKPWFGSCEEKSMTAFGTAKEVIWSVDTDFYTVIPDNVAAGRLAFDQTGHLYITIGGKASYSKLHELDTPYGKIHRVNDDGSVPEDNPFWQRPEDRSVPSTRHTVWSLGTAPLRVWRLILKAALSGHRKWDRVVATRSTGSLQAAWPLYTEGLDYDGEPINIGKELGLDFPLTQTIRPVVDFTPAPSLSNVTFHHGRQFPNWQHDLLVGSLRARTLFRIRIDNNEVVALEKLVEHLGRIRDVDMGRGFIYILLEHQDTGSLVRLVPFDNQ